MKHPIATVIGTLDERTGKASPFPSEGPLTDHEAVLAIQAIRLRFLKPDDPLDGLAAMLLIDAVLDRVVSLPAFEV